MKVGIRNKVTVIITRLDTITDKRGRSGKVIFGCGKCRNTNKEIV